MIKDSTKNNIENNSQDIDENFLWSDSVVKKIKQKIEQIKKTEGKKITQSYIAKTSFGGEKNQPYVSNILSGKKSVSAKAIEGFAKALNCDSSYFYPDILEKEKEGIHHKTSEKKTSYLLDEKKFNDIENHVLFYISKNDSYESVSDKNIYKIISQIYIALYNIDHIDAHSIEKALINTLLLQSFSDPNTTID